MTKHCFVAQLNTVVTYCMCSAYMGPDAGEDVMQQHHVLLLQSSAITDLTTLYTQVPCTE